MKKYSNLFKSCLCLSMTAFFIACSNGGSGDSLFTQISVDSIQLPAGYENAESATIDDRASIDILLDSNSSIIEEAVSKCADFSDILDSGARSMRVDQLPTIGEEIQNKMNAYYNDMEANGRGSMSYTKNIGEITGLDDGFTMNIPLISINIAQSSNQSETGTINTSVASSQKLISIMTEDFTKTSGNNCGEIKNCSVATSQSNSIAMKVAFDMSSMTQQELIEYYTSAMDSNSYFDITKFMTVTGKMDFDYQASSALTFVTEDNVAGKIAIDLSVTSSIKNLGDYLSAGQESNYTIDLSDTLNNTNTNVCVKIDVYNLDGEFLYNYKTITTFTEAEKYLNIMEAANSNKQ